MGMDVYGRENEEAYFRSNIWGWGPIMAVVDTANQIYELGFNTSDWHSNDGHGLETQEECNRLADAMEKVISNSEDGVIRSKPTPMASLMGCLFGMPRASAVSEADLEFVQEFVTFLRSCGGFRIH